MIKKIKAQVAIKSEIRKKEKLEKAVAKVKRQQQIEEKEKIKLQLEKERLLSLDNKELLVELIFAVRGFYNQVEQIEKKQSELADKIVGIESYLADLELDICNLESEINSKKD